MDVGIDSLAAILPDPATGRLPSTTDRVAEFLEETEVATVSGSIALTSANTIALNFSTPRPRSFLPLRRPVPATSHWRIEP
jgi:hypothetical protein